MIEGSTQMSHDRKALKKGNHNEEKSSFEVDIAVIKQTMATKLDLSDLNRELRTDIDVIKQTMATKTDIAELKGDIKALSNNKWFDRSLGIGVFVLLIAPYLKAANIKTASLMQFFI